MSKELNASSFKEAVDNRQRVPKKELDKMKIEAFDRILEKSHNFYETFDTVDGLEHDFASQEFGEWVEEYIVDFHSLVAEERD